MKALIISLFFTFDLLAQFIVPTPVVQITNNWRLGSFFGVSCDTVYTGTYWGESGQVFAQKGEPTPPGYAWRIQSTWIKNVNWVPLPDTLILELRVIETQGINKILLSPTLQDTLMVAGGLGEYISLNDSSWQRIVFSLQILKDSSWFSNGIIKFYWSFSLRGDTAGTFGAKIEVKKMSGKYGEEEIIIDSFSFTSIREGDFCPGFSLEQNYPNPFNPSTTIEFRLTSEAIVDLRIYNILGQEVAVLIEKEIKSAGNYSINFNAEGLPSGTYIYRLLSGNEIVTRKMILMR